MATRRRQKRKIMIYLLVLLHAFKKAHICLKINIIQAIPAAINIMKSHECQFLVSDNLKELRSRSPILYTENAQLNNSSYKIKLMLHKIVKNRYMIR